MKPKRFGLAIVFGDVEQSVGEQHDKAQLIGALEAAHARDHDLVTEIAALKKVQQALDEALHTRTIERDHFAQDGHLWSLCLAYLCEQEMDGYLALPADAVNALEGLMLSANVEDGIVRINVAERPQASQEGGG